MSAIKYEPIATTILQTENVIPLGLAGRPLAKLAETTGVHLPTATAVVGTAIRAASIGATGAFGIPILAGAAADPIQINFKVPQDCVTSARATVYLHMLASANAALATDYARVLTTSAPLPLNAVSVVPTAGNIEFQPTGGFATNTLYKIAAISVLPSLAASGDFSMMITREAIAGAGHTEYGGVLYFISATMCYVADGSLTTKTIVTTGL